MTRVIIMGAGGRDFHDFNVVFRDDPATTSSPSLQLRFRGSAGAATRASLAGQLYPDGIPIHDEAELDSLIRQEDVDEVVLSYSDLSHLEVMHRASAALAAGADFRLLGPERTMLESSLPVVAVCAVRTGGGKVRPPAVSPASCAAKASTPSSSGILCHTVI